MRVSAYLLIILFVGAACGSGCTFNNDSVAKAKAIAQDKKQKHEDLFAQLSAKKLPQGITASEIVEKFGEPDDVLKSGSSTGSFEVWTYEKITIPGKKDKDDWENVILYFDNNRLITWKY
jgi:outer membrane protein assembly factor BamE (lipoprotein component of BamABCDE complex)